VNDTTSARAEREEHVINQRRSPINVLLICSCGWTWSISRQQNALARSAKARAAIKAHLIDRCYSSR
jgi:hypothetical protein